jgi:hypothetical protein
MEESQSKNGLTGCLTFIAIIAIMSFIATMFFTNKKPDESKRFENIKVTVDFQDFYNENGYQKVVVFAKNESKEIFNGKIKVRIIDNNNVSYARDIIYINDLNPGLSSWAIIWAKPGGIKLDYEIELP